MPTVAQKNEEAPKQVRELQDAKGQRSICDLFQPSAVESTAEVSMYDEFNLGLTKIFDEALSDHGNHGNKLGERDTKTQRNTHRRHPGPEGPQGASQEGRSKVGRGRGRQRQEVVRGRGQVRRNGLAKSGRERNLLQEPLAADITSRELVNGVRLCIDAIEPGPH